MICVPESLFNMQEVLMFKLFYKPEILEVQLLRSELGSQMKCLLCLYKNNNNMTGFQFRFLFVNS